MYGEASSAHPIGNTETRTLKRQVQYIPRGVEAVEFDACCGYRRNSRTAHRFLRNRWRTYWHGRNCGLNAHCTCSSARSRQHRRLSYRRLRRLCGEHLDVVRILDTRHTASETTLVCGGSSYVILRCQGETYIVVVIMYLFSRCPRQQIIVAPWCQSS